ncbi:MAG TPA: universal stress protein UspA, partial [Rhodospirillaceae bacterium]|nr:universal stress protein UspA [Rhodospirillaceae bacterium]
MSIKTLLVHLAPDPDRETRLKAAVGIAKQLDAHLIALYVAMPVHMPAGAEGRGASSR